LEEQTPISYTLVTRAAPVQCMRAFVAQKVVIEELLPQHSLVISQEITQLALCVQVQAPERAEISESDYEVNYPNAENC
jgi:hypothetical protein